MIDKKKKPSYLKSAFFWRIDLPGLGGLPINIVALLGFLMLGFGHPGFWLLGLGLEALFLYSVATNERFRRLIDAKHAILSDREFAQQWRDLVYQLSAEKQKRLDQLQNKCGQILEQHRESGSIESIVDANQDALRQLSWLFLKLLLARTNLESLERQANEADLQKQIAALEKDLANPSVSASVKDSKEATVEILKKRVLNLDRRETSMQEIDSDLSRIEAQIDLALENATMQGQPQAISANVELFSQALDERLYGDSAAAIASVERALRQTH